VILLILPIFWIRLVGQLKTDTLLSITNLTELNEWEGEPNPTDMHKFLIFAVTRFKQENKDFFIISAGLDNASVNDTGQSIDEFNFMYQMDDAVPGYFPKSTV